MKKIYRVPFIKPYDVVYHNIKAEDKETIQSAKAELQEIFKGDGVMCIDKARYQWQWYDDSEFEIEI